MDASDAQPDTCAFSRSRLMLPAKRRALLDAVVVLGCSAAYLAADLAGLPIGWIIPVVVAVLAGYGLLVLRRRGETWREFGLRLDNLGAAGWRVGCFTLAAAAAMIVAAMVHKRPVWRPELAVMLPLYPLWGLVQQFIFQGILHRALLVLLPNRTAALVVNSLAFGLVHVSDPRVAGLTAAAGAVWSWFYQRWPNIWVLGVSHGILAALAYPLLLDENPVERFW